MTGKFGTSPFDNAARLSDEDRTAAMNQLAQAVGEGRLTVAEFEDRSDDIMRAQTRGELVPVFRDIPLMRTQELKVYSQGDINRARDAGKKPKLATALVGSLALLFGAIAFFAGGEAADSVGMLLGGIGSLVLIPILWIMLYVAKVGPASWNTPSPRAIERQRRKEIQAATAEARAQQKAIESQMWAQRRQQAGELTGEAMDFAKRKFTQWNQHG